MIAAYKLPEFRVWCKIRERCNSSRCPAYKNYGGRGIKLCARWDTFANFYADMGQRPSPEHTIERVDVDQGYMPGNCVWIHGSRQNRNLRRTAYVDYAGQRIGVTDLVEKLKLPSRQAFYNRLRYGWPIERAISQPLRPRRKKQK